MTAMALKDDIQFIIKEFQAQQERLENDRDLYKINEGNLKPYVVRELEKQLSPKSFEQAVHRIAPINVLKRLIDKLSKLYTKPPTRKLMNGQTDAGASDQDLFNQILSNIEINKKGVTFNRYFNLTKSSAYEPILRAGKPALRILASHKFFVMGMDEEDQGRVTHFIKIMRQKQKTDGKTVTVLYVYTDTEFLAIDSDGGIDEEVMTRPNIAALNGSNPIGKIPFVYEARTEDELIPECDTDLLPMVILVPLLLSDINYALMFQCFSIITMTNVKEEGLKRAPNAAWILQKDDQQGPDPKVEVIKPEVDSDKALAALKSQLSLWMTSRNIKPGAMGDMSIENLASGVAKIIDESDTSEDRQNQVPFIQSAEEKLFDLILNYMHPHWLAEDGYAYKQSFSEGLSVSVTFPEQKPVVDSSKAISDQVTKMTNGLQSKRGALRELYPDWDEDEIDAKLEEIQNEAQAKKEEATESAEEEATEQEEMQDVERGDALTEEEPTVQASSSK